MTFGRKPVFQLGPHQQSAHYNSARSDFPDLLTPPDTGILSGLRQYDGGAGPAFKSFAAQLQAAMPRITGQQLAVVEQVLNGSNSGAWSTIMADAASVAGAGSVFCSGSIDGIDAEKFASDFAAASGGKWVTIESTQIGGAIESLIDDGMFTSAANQIEAMLKADGKKGFFFF